MRSRADRADRVWRGALAVGALLAILGGALSGAATSYDHRTRPGDDPRPAWQRCAAGTVPVMGKTLSGTVCIPGSLVAGDQVQQ